MNDDDCGWKGGREGRLNRGKLLSGTRERWTYNRLGKGTKIKKVRARFRRRSRDERERKLTRRSKSSEQVSILQQNAKVSPTNRQKEKETASSRRRSWKRKMRSGQFCSRENAKRQYITRNGNSLNEMREVLEQEEKPFGSNLVLKNLR